MTLFEMRAIRVLVEAFVSARPASPGNKAFSRVIIAMRGSLVGIESFWFPVYLG